MDSARRIALVAGLFYLITFAASIPAVFLLAPVLNNAGYIAGPGADTRVLWGCFLDLVNALACIGTAVALFPVVRRHPPEHRAGRHRPHRPRTTSRDIRRHEPSRAGPARQAPPVPLNGGGPRGEGGPALPARGAERGARHARLHTVERAASATPRGRDRSEC